MNNDKRFYSKDKLFSYRAFLNISLGARGTGKTTCAKFWCIDDFLKTKKKLKKQLLTVLNLSKR